MIEQTTQRELTEERELLLSNAVVAAKWRVSLNELRLILLAVAKIRPDNMGCEVTVEEFADIWRLSRTVARKTFRRIRVALEGRKIALRKDEMWLDFSIIHPESSVELSGGRMSVHLNGMLTALFTGLNDHFFKVGFRQLRKLDTVTSIRLYFLARSIYNANVIDKDFNEFQASVGTNYKSRKNFIQQAVKPAIRSVNLTDVRLKLLPAWAPRVRIHVEAQNHEAILVREFGFKPKDARDVVRTARSRPDFDDYMDQCLRYCRENLAKGVIHSNVTSYVRKFILEDFRPKNPRSMLRERDEELRRERRELERKKRDEARASQREMERQMERFHRERSSDDLQRLLREIVEDPDKNDFFKDLVREELRKGASDIRELSGFMQCEVLERWRAADEA